MNTQADVGVSAAQCISTQEHQPETGPAGQGPDTPSDLQGRVVDAVQGRAPESTDGHDHPAQIPHSEDPQRVAFCAALRELADFLEAHPDLPLPMLAKLSPHLNGTDEEDRAEVDRIAGILGTEPGLGAGGGHYQVARRFGGADPRAGLSYEATAISAECMARYQEHMADYHAAERTASR